MPLHRRTLLLFTLAILPSASACKRETPPEPGAQGTTATSATPVLPPEAPARPTSRQPFERDDAGHLIPRSVPPPLSSSDRVPTPGREPDWDIDPDDAARDYADRYVRATNRYGDKTACARAAASRSDGGRTLVDVVEVKDAPCNLGGAVLDTFAVRAADDRLELADPKRGAPLAKWPDGSAPGAPPTGKIAAEDDLHKWTSPLHELLNGMHFTAIRVQYYGRGSYPVVTVAGWRDPIRPGGADDLHDFAKKVCGATKGAPVGIFGGMNRADILRVRCPDRGRWERL